MFILPELIFICYCQNMIVGIGIAGRVNANDVSYTLALDVMEQNSKTYRVICVIFFYMYMDLYTPKQVMFLFENYVLTLAFLTDSSN